jgi:hypothetical protein
MPIPLRERELKYDKKASLRSGRLAAMPMMPGYSARNAQTNLSRLAVRLAPPGAPRQQGIGKKNGKMAVHADHSNYWERV